MRPEGNGTGGAGRPCRGDYAARRALGAPTGLPDAAIRASSSPALAAPIRASISAGS